MINTLIEQITKKDAPIVVGLDPMLSYVPEHICKAAFEQYGETLEGAAEAIWQFNKGIVDATHDLIPAVKPQIAMYEQFGVEGLIVYKRTVDYCGYAVADGGPTTNKAHALLKYGVAEAAETQTEGTEQKGE